MSNSDVHTIETATENSKTQLENSKKARMNCEASQFIIITNTNQGRLQWPLLMHSPAK